MAKRPTREELEHDEVADSVTEAVDFLQRHYMKIILLMILIAGAVVVKVAMDRREARIHAEINRSIAQALDQLTQIQNQPDLQARSESVDELAPQLQTIYDNFSDDPLAQEALFLKGRAYYEADRFEEAQAAYQAYIDAVDSEMRQARGNLALGYAYENASFLEEDPEAQRSHVDAGRSRYERAALLAPDTYLYYYALLGQARLNELIQNNARALELYQQVLDERPLPTVTLREDEELDPREQADMVALLRRTLNRAEEQLSLRRTAELRLERLRARLGEDAPVVESEEELAPTPTPAP